MLLSKRLFILALLPCLLAASEVKLKIAVVSDVHEKWNELEKVFRFLAEKSPDAILFGGDLANGNPASGRKYMEIFNRHFSKNSPVPVHLPIMGNHDYLGYPKGAARLPAKESMKRFFCPLGFPAVWLWQRRIKGYTFIGVSATDDKGESRHTEAEIEEVSRRIGQAEKAAPGRPVFVLTHLPPAGKLLRSGFVEKPSPKARYHWRTDHIRRMLEKHPQAVSISGHTHLALEDERCFWQGGFTAVHGGVLRWVTPCSPEPSAKSIETLARFKGRNFIYIEVFENKMVIYRFDAGTLKEISPGKRWIVSLPYVPGKVLDTLQRKKQAAEPRFPAGAGAEILRKGRQLYLKLDRAEHPDMVLAYQVRLTYSDPRQPSVTFFVASDYFLHGKKEDDLLNISEKLKLSPGTGMMEITPYETFGKAGKSLTAKFTIPAPEKTKRRNAK